MTSWKSNDDEDAVDYPYMISEYKFLKPLVGNASIELAQRLALELHNHQSAQGIVTHEIHIDDDLCFIGFGFECATYCGATRIQGHWFPSWSLCFSDMIKSLLDGLRSTSRFQELAKLGDQTVERSVFRNMLKYNLNNHASVIPFLLGPPLQVEPVLLHGDLWVGWGVSTKRIKIDVLHQSGNVGVDSVTKKAVIYDPASVR